MTAPDTLPEPDLSGRTVDRYHLLHRLGVGGMGAVYEAEHTRLRKRFAVKLLRFELARNELFRKRFLREARAASAVSHPHVVAISDFGETDDGHVFFVMDLLAGRDLQELLEQQSVLPWPRTREILLQVTSALQAAHEQDIIHRDIKPSNVFLADIPGKGDDDFVKVLDFGIAKLAGNVGEATAKLTSTDEVFGTVAYMAPEMAMGKNDDPRSDTYAVGVMMYRMLTGQLPFTEGTAFQILAQHINAPIPSLREKNPAIPEAVEAIVRRAMAKQLDDRFPTMEAFNQVLRRGTLEGTEVLVGVQAALQAEAIRDPLAARPGAPDIDRTTPLPAQASGAQPSLRTQVASPLPQPSPFAATESGGLSLQTVVAGDSGVAPAEPATAPQPPESTLLLDSSSVSKPIAEDAVLPEVSAHHDHETIHEPDEPDEYDEHDEPDEPDDRRRSPLGWLLPVASAAAVLGVAGFFMLGGRGDPPDAKAPAQMAASGSAVDPEDERLVDQPTALESNESKAEPSAAPDPEPVESEPAEPVANDGTEPAAEPEPPAKPEPPAVKPEPAASPEKTKTAPTTSPKPNRSKTPKPKPTPKLKTDKEVVNALKAKITAKCKDQISGKVRVEGVINPAGRVEGLLVTPQNGLGGCMKLVKAAKFDPRGGVRPMPRFSVEP